MPSRIEDYALIGDCETAALVALDGSIDWLCLPRFDSDACFAALLGTNENGRWRIAPKGAESAARRCYRGNSLILESTFESPTGRVVMVDFMPLRDETVELVRLVTCTEGAVEIRSELVLRFGYGATVPWVTQPERGVLRAVAGPDMAILRTPAEMHGENLHTVSEFQLRAGETVPFVLTHAPSHRPLPPAIDPVVALGATNAFWADWSAKARVGGPFAPEIMRSLITLKTLTYAPTGGIVAAPTTSLPETLGGIRNWDYRFCWLRDATLTLLALINAGYSEEARAWRDWLVRAVAGTPSQAQIMYGIAGERRLTEWEVPWLKGYEGSVPVRIGNAAHDQVQLDVQGEVIDTFYQGLRAGLDPDPDGWRAQCMSLRHLSRTWREPDRGIWESRGEPRHYTYSKVMAWVAFDRGIRCIEEFGFEGPRDRWREIRDEIHADVCAKGFDESVGSFMQSYGSKYLDGSLLLIASSGFIDPCDPRMVGTVAAIEKRLVVDGLVMRHDPAERETGLDLGEGAFIACSFWLADAYVLQGRREDARRLYDHLLSLRNDVGLLAEEYDTARRRQVGNFPQAFSHIALINTAQNLSRLDKPAVQRAGDAGARTMARDARAVP
jgi:GH15 family glucan-1,4-alpha-glucosidase